MSELFYSSSSLSVLNYTQVHLMTQLAKKECVKIRAKDECENVRTDVRNSIIHFSYKFEYSKTKI